MRCEPTQSAFSHFRSLFRRLRFSVDMIGSPNRFPKSPGHIQQCPRSQRSFGMYLACPHFRSPFCWLRCPLDMIGCRNGFPRSPGHNQHCPRSQRCFGMALLFCTGCDFLGSSRWPSYGSAYPMSLLSKSSDEVWIVLFGVPVVRDMFGSSRRPAKTIEFPDRDRKSPSTSHHCPRSSRRPGLEAIYSGDDARKRGGAHDGDNARRYDRNIF